MSDMNGRGGNAEQDPNHILNELAALEYDIDKTLSSQIQKAKDAQKKAILEHESSQAADALSNVALAYAKELQLRLKSIQGNPRSKEPRNRPTVDRLERKLKEVIQDFRVDVMTFGKESVTGLARLIRVTDRDISLEDSQRTAEVLISGGNDQVFSHMVCLFPNFFDFYG